MDGGPTTQRRATGVQLHPGAVLVALATYVCCTAFFIGADQWDPLAGWGFPVLIANSLAIGLVGGRWWLLLAALTLIALAPLTRAPEPVLFFWLALPVLVALSGAFIGLGVWLRRRMRRRGAETEQRAAYVGLGVFGVAVAITGWGVYLDHRVVDHVPSRPVVIDERTGTYRGIAAGAPAARARRLFGEPVVDSGNYVPRPLDVKPREVSGPSSLPGWQPWR